MMEYKISDFATDDSKALRIEIFVNEQRVPVELEIDDKDQAGKAKHIVLYDGETPVATARFYLESENMWHIGRICVSRERRGTGLGRELLEIAEAEIKKLGGDKAYISAQTQAKGFYESIGYKAYGDTYMEDTIEHIAMYKDL
ncbi:MAG: GNAT family N-acetyltransferase [Eubacterium sp.]